MSDIETVTLDGGELKVEGLGGQNTIIVNRGSAMLYASINPGIVPDGDNVAAIPSGGAMNLRGTNGTVYLLGTGKVQLQGTDISWLPISLGGPSGGGSAGGVSQEYVDNADALTLNAAKKYTDDEIDEVRGEIPVIPDSLPADGGNAETAERLATARTINGVAFDGSEDIEIDAVTADELADLKGYIGYTDSDIYGLEADFENNKFTRLAGAVGKNPGENFDSVRAFGGRRRCVLKLDGTVYAYYGDSNYEEDGTIGTWETGAANVFIDAMVEQPKFYYKVVPLKTEKIDGADGYHLRKARYYISDTPKAGFKVHPAFIQNGVEVDKIYLSAYEGCVNWDDVQDINFDSDRLRSIANAKPASGTTQALTRDNARKLARNRGAGWGITTIQTLSATQLLFAIEYATFNSQSAIGNGVVNTTAPINTGSTSSLGNVSGSVSGGGVSYRGEENLWGNMYKFVDGIFFDNSAGSGYDSMMYFPGDEQKFPCYKATNKYPSTLQYISEYDWLFWGSEYNGNTAFLTGDIVWNGYTGYNLSPMAGGRWSNAQNAGLFCYSVYMSEAKKSDSCSARLIYIPQPETTQEVTAE